MNEKQIAAVNRVAGADAPADKPDSSLIIRGSDVQSRSVRWAWEGRLAIGYLTVQTGVEGLGKSVFAAWMIAMLTRGRLRGEWKGSPVDVLVVAGEDGIEDTWKPRLDLAGADMDRVAFLNLALIPPDWDLRDGIDQLRAAVTETGARMLFIDAALDHMPPAKAGESINSPSFVRQALGPLKRAVRELELVGLFSLHPPKARSSDFRDLVQASQAFSAIPRIGLLFAYHPDDDRDDPDCRRVLIRGKGNLGRDPGALEFHVVGRDYDHDDGRTTEREVVVDVAPSPITLADLAPNRALGAREPTKAERAAEIIREALGDREWHLADPIGDELAGADLGSGSVVTKARKLAGVEKRKRPGEINGPWEWRIRPEDPSDGNMESSPPARARGLSDDGKFDSGTSIPSEHGKFPSFPSPQQNAVDQPKFPRRRDIARGRVRDRILADLSDADLLAAFPGASIEVLDALPPLTGEAA